MKEDITLSVELPVSAVIARTLEVACGGSYVTIRQIMGRSDADWTVYEGDAFDVGRNKGLVGVVAHAPRADNAEALVPWAADLVSRRERAKLAQVELQRVADDKPHPVQDHDDSTSDQG